MTAPAASCATSWPPVPPPISTPSAPRKGGARRSTSGRLVRGPPRTMDASTEGRLLRLAIAKGLLTWEDLDRIVEALPEGESRQDRSWLRLVLDAGLLDEAQVSRLTAELSNESTPNAGPIVFPPEHRFLAGWPRYRVERLLGSGGMGTVFLAFDPSLDRRVALKLLHRNDPEQTGRFLREARAQARVE